MYHGYCDIITVETEDEADEVVASGKRKVAVGVKGNLPGKRKLVFQACHVLLRNKKKMLLNELLVEMEKTAGTLNPTDFKSFLKENNQLFDLNTKQSSVSLKSDLNIIYRLLMTANVQNNLKSKEHGNYLAKNGCPDWSGKFKVSATHGGFLKVENVLAVVLPYHLSIKVKSANFLIPFFPPSQLEVGEAVVAHLCFSPKLNRVLGVSKLSQTDRHNLETKYQTIRRDIQRTAILHHILGNNKPLNLNILYSKMGKRYKENTNFSCFREELRRCNIFKIHKKGMLTLNMCLKLEYLVTTRANVSIVKDKNVSRYPPIPTSTKPRTEVCGDQKILKIRNLKANISGGKYVFLRFTEKVALKIGTKYLESNLQEGVNQNITLSLDLKQIYKTGDCLVEMEERSIMVTSAEDKFEWDEDLVEDFANNPFLSSPVAEILNLSDSDDEEDTEQMGRNIV